MKLAGLQKELEDAFKASPALEVKWAVMKDWNETMRYDLTIDANDAKDLFSACNAHRVGVLPWIRKRW